MKPMTANAVRGELRKHINPEKAAFYPRFFKAGKGQYAEGDRFLGVVVPDQRRVAKQFSTLPRAEVTKLLADRLHECRLTAVLILTHQFDRAGPSERKEVIDFLMAHLDRVNHWDIVDTAGPKLLGRWLLNHPRDVLNDLADTGDLWKERIAIVSCLPLIKAGQFREIKRLAKRFLGHQHDLIQKATGWMLREMGKQDQAELYQFLDRHAARMPRTMLRYSIEHLSPAERKTYMSM